MSGAMEEAEEMWALGLSTIPAKHLCRHHINDPAVFKFIAEESQWGSCDYCESRRKVVPLETALVFLMQTVAHFYTDPANYQPYDSSEGGYMFGHFDNGAEVLFDGLGLEVDGSGLDVDIVESMAWQPWADETDVYGNEAEFLNNNWANFKSVVKNRSRYFFNQSKIFKSREFKVDPESFLNDLGRKTQRFILIREIPAYTNLYRTRQHAKKEIISSLGQVSSPPIDKTKNANRMSPAGVSMFYAAFDRRISVEETIDVSNLSEDYYSTVILHNKRNLRVIDFSLLPPVPSFFEQESWEVLYQIQFLKDLMEDLTKPINRDGMQHIEYVPTQIITEYYRYVFSNKTNRIDGIVYPSSKDRTKNACVLFFDHKESQQEMELSKSKIIRKKVKYS